MRAVAVVIGADLSSSDGEAAGKMHPIEGAGRRRTQNWATKGIAAF